MENSNVLIKKVKEKLDEEKIACLNDIFKSLSGFPPEVNRRKYRNHNIDRMDILDELESSNQLLRADESHTHYRIIPYALLLIDNPESELIQTNMETVFIYFQEIYKNQDVKPVTFSEIKESLKTDEVDVKLALYYLCETHSVYSGKDQKKANPLGYFERVYKTFHTMQGENHPHTRTVKASLESDKAATPA
jgi:hypothetical protein